MKGLMIILFFLYMYIYIAQVGGEFNKREKYQMDKMENVHIYTYIHIYN